MLHEVLVAETAVAVAGLPRRDGRGKVTRRRPAHAVGDEKQVGAGKGCILVVLADTPHLGVDAEVEGERLHHTSSLIMVRPIRRMSFTVSGVGSVMRLPLT